MKLIAGVVLAGAVAAGVAVRASGRGGPGPLPAEKPKGKHKDFEHTTLGKTAFLEHAAFSGSYEHLDGPAREGMNRDIIQVNADAAGNLYIYDFQGCAIRAVRKRDGRLFTLCGNRHITFGTPGKEGPADSLRLAHNSFIAMPSMAAVGNPLEGKGSLYFTDDWASVVVRLWRKPDGVWWYERIAGLGKQKPAPGLAAADVRFARSAAVATEKGEIGLILGSDRSAALYWLRDGKLVAAYDHARVEKEAGTTFYCRGIDAKGNFVGATGEYNKAQKLVIVVSPDGKTVRKIPTPYAPQWTVCPDRKRERWFFRACDDYTIQYVDPAGKAFRLLRAGTWAPLTSSKGNRGAGEGLNWSRGNTLPDGRYAGWSTGGNSPVFLATWLDEGGR